jgi:thiamine-phosphate pyrophosphorylase
VNALPGRLLLVTDRSLSSRPLVETVRAAVEAGCRWVWLRDRDLERGARRRLALEVRAAIGGRAALTVGADVELAAEAGAQGVHLPAGADIAAARKRLGPDALVGVSAHSLADVAAARDAGADYATLSPIFPTPSKPGYGPALGLGALSEAAALGCPVLALGGVTPVNAAACIAAGAAGVAVMGGILAAPRPGGAAADYLRALPTAAQVGGSERG